MKTSDSKSFSRRNFTKLAAASSVFSLIPGRVIGANEKVNIAYIGVGGQGGGDARTIHGKGLTNTVALCDVALGSGSTSKLEGMFPKAAKFKDFRKMFDKMEKDIDCCTVAVPNHAHFPISMLAMSLGKGVYVEKPLAHTFNEITLMMAAEKKYKVACQMGNQGHSGANYHQFKAWKEAGVIKDVTRVDAFMNSGRRWHPWKFDEWQTGEEMPEGLDWDTWTCTAPMHPFSKYLHPGNWRSWFEYGNGAFGDWGPHLLDTVHRFLDLGMPQKVTAVKLDGPRKLIFPMASTIQFDFPERGKEPACKVTWYDGVKNRPERPKELEESRNPGNNGKFIYSKDYTFMGRSHGAPLVIIPEEKRREVGANLPKFPSGSDHYLNFVLAVKGEEKTRSSFDVSGPLSQMFCLGVIAQRLGGSFTFDRKTQQVTDNKLANELLVGPPPRKGWEEFYKL